MRKLIAALIASFWLGPLSAAEPAPDSVLLEKDLQSLSWSKFRSVVEAVPKMKASIEAYGSFGWQYVKMNYKTHGWRKNIEKLDPDQKEQLAGLVRAAKGRN